MGNGDVQPIAPLGSVEHTLLASAVHGVEEPGPIPIATIFPDIAS